MLILDQLTTIRARLAMLILGRTPCYRDGATPRDHPAALNSRLEALEADLSRRNASFRVAAQPVTIDAIQAALPPEAALVEFMRFRCF